MKLSPDRKLYAATACISVVAAALLSVAVLLTQAAVERGEQAAPALVMIWLFVTAMAYAALRPLVDLFVRTPAAMAEETRILVRDSDRRLKPAGAGELQSLVGAVNELAERRQSLERDVAAEI